MQLRTALTQAKNMANPVIATQLATFLVVAICFYTSNIILLISPSLLLYTLPIHPAATIILKPQLKATPLGVHLIINGNFWIPLAVNSTIPYALFIIGCIALTISLALDIHPDTAPNWYGILKAKYKTSKIKEALRKIASKRSFLAIYASIQTSAILLTITAFYHYAVNYIVNGGLQWEIQHGTTLINPAILVIIATILILSAKIMTYEKIKQTVQHQN